jgi:hypothetical protein
MNVGDFPLGNSNDRACLRCGPHVPRPLAPVAAQSDRPTMTNVVPDGGEFAPKARSRPSTMARRH